MATHYEKSSTKMDERSSDVSNELERASAKNERTSTIDLEEDKLHEMTASYSEISFDSQPSPCEGSITEDQSFQTLALSSELTTVSCTEKGNLEIDCNKTYEDFSHASDSKRPATLDLTNESSSTDSQKYYKALEDLQLEGTVSTDGDMVLFVAEDLETKIKLASPVSKKGDTPPFPGSRSSTPSLYRQALMPQLSNIDPNVLYDIEIEARRVATSVDTLTENLAGILHSVSALTVECLETYRDAVCKTCDAVDSNIKSMYQLMAKFEELSKSMKSIYKLSEQIKLEYLHEEVRGLLDTLPTKITLKMNGFYVCTDGSATPREGKAGAGVYSKSFEISHHAGENGSNFDGEVIAVPKALEKVKDCKENKIVILTFEIRNPS